MPKSIDTRISRLEKTTPRRDPDDPWDFIRDPGWWYVERQPYNQVPQLVNRAQVEGRIRELEAKESPLPKWVVTYRL